MSAFLPTAVLERIDAAFYSPANDAEIDGLLHAVETEGERMRVRGSRLALWADLARRRGWRARSGALDMIRRLEINACAIRETRRILADWRASSRRRLAFLPTEGSA